MQSAAQNVGERPFNRRQIAQCQLAIVQLAFAQAAFDHVFDMRIKFFRRQFAQRTRRCFHRIGEHHNRGFLALRTRPRITKQGFIDQSDASSTRCFVGRVLHGFQGATVKIRDQRASVMLRDNVLHGSRQS